MELKLISVSMYLILTGCASIFNIEPDENKKLEKGPFVKGSYSYEIVNCESTLPLYMENVADLTFRIPQTDDTLPLPTVILEPGFFSFTAQLDDVQNRLASHGFLVVGVNNKSHFQIITTNLEPYKSALLETVHYLIESNVNKTHPVYGKIDTNAIGITGHSMGGGGVIMACDSVNAAYNKYIKTAIAMNPYGKCDGSNIKIPLMMFASDLDAVVNPLMPSVNASTANVFFSFNTLVNCKKKLFANYKNMDHNGVVDSTFFLSTSGNAELFLPTMVSWFKVYLLGETEFEKYLDSNSNEFKLISNRFVEKNSAPAYLYVK